MAAHDARLKPHSCDSFCECNADCLDQVFCVINSNNNYQDSFSDALGFAMSASGKRKSIVFDDIPDLQSNKQTDNGAADEESVDPGDKVLRLDASLTGGVGGKGKSGHAKEKGKSKPTPSRADIFAENSEHEAEDLSEERSRSRPMSQSSCASARSQSTASTGSQELDFNLNSFPSTPGPSRAQSPSSGRATPGLSGLAYGLSINSSANDEESGPEDDATDVMQELQDGVKEITDTNGDLLASTQAPAVVTDQRSLLGREEAAPDPEGEAVEELRDYSDAELELTDGEDDDLEPGTKERLLRDMVALDVVPGTARQINHRQVQKRVSFEPIFWYLGVVL